LLNLAHLSQCPRTQRTVKSLGLRPHLHYDQMHNFTPRATATHASWSLHNRHFSADLIRCSVQTYRDINPHLFCFHRTESLRTAQTQELQQQQIHRTSWCSLPRSECGLLLPSKSIHPLVNDRKAPSKMRDNRKLLDFIISHLLKTREQS